MKFTIGLAATGLATIVLAVPSFTSKHTVHERRSRNDAWFETDVQLHERVAIPLSIGLTQRNLDKGHDFLMDVADPTSKNYGKHWSPEKIAETFAPAQETIDTVLAWLASSGIEKERVTLSKGKNWLRVNSTVAESEALLKTKYKVFAHKETEQPHVACDEYSVPAELVSHIDFITPTVHFDVPVKVGRKRNVQARGVETRSLEPHVVEVNSVANAELDSAATPDLADCFDHIRPACIRALYGLPFGTLNLSSFGIFESTPQRYLYSDLDKFYAKYAPNVPIGTRPTLRLIDGANNKQTPPEDIDVLFEATLDVQYAIPFVYPQKVTVYNNGDPLYPDYSGSFNNFLDIFDSSYCAGDDPFFDQVYPNPAPGGYKKKDCGTDKLPAVLSVSYGYNEADLSPAYENRQCNEYLKLGLQGSTILFASGDYGVAGNGGQCCLEAKCAGSPPDYDGSNYTPPEAKFGNFNPSFPPTCPYVTAVGATQILPNATVDDPEQASQAIIYSGGGFSNIFAMPSYQTAAQKYYFSHNSPDFTATQYNNSQTVRGYPDLSANGAYYVVIANGTGYRLAGTSASTPVIGSIITLINNERAKAGKGSVGFINPTIYKNPAAFNDIKRGGNRGCGTRGFRSVTGWDPVTGLGTPDYKKLLDVFMALP